MKHDPLRYAVDEGFVKIFWWKQDAELHHIMVCLYPGVMVFHDENTFIVFPDNYYPVNETFYRIYGTEVSSWDMALAGSFDFSADAKEVDSFVGPNLDGADEFNQRREQEES